MYKSYYHIKPQFFSDSSLPNSSLPELQSAMSNTVDRVIGRVDPVTGEKPLFREFIDVLPAAKHMVS